MASAATTASAVAMRWRRTTRHERSQVAAANVDALALQLSAQHACAHERVLQMQLVDAAHERQICLPGKPGQVVNTATADAQ